MPNITLSGDNFKFFFVGPSKLPSYIKKIKRNQKRGESSIHASTIILGFILGLVLGYTLLRHFAVDFARRFNLRDVQIIVNLLFATAVATFMSSSAYYLSKASVDLYNLKKYKVSNSQFKPLSESEIKLIVKNSEHELNVTDQAVSQLHESLVIFIQSQNYPHERQRLKQAHWEFRKGNLSKATKTHPLVLDALQSVMTDTLLSRTFVKQRTNIAYISESLEHGEEINSIQDRISNCISTVERLLTDLVLLRDVLGMASNGIAVHDHIPLTRISRNSSILNSLNECTQNNVLQESQPVSIIITCDVVSDDNNNNNHNNCHLENNV